MPPLLFRPRRDAAPSGGAASRPARRRNPWVTAAAAVACALVWATLCNLVLETLQRDGDVVLAVEEAVQHNFSLFALGSGVLAVTLLLVLALTGRLWVSCAALLVAVAALGTADAIKLRLRSEPLYPSDLAFVRTPGFLASMVGPWRLALMLLLLAAVAGVVLLVGWASRRWFPPVRRREHPRAWAVLLGLRLLTAVACIGALGYASQFNTPGNRLRAAYDESGSTWMPWFQSGNYRTNGFVGGVLYNMPVPAMRKPPGYSEATMRRLAERYTREAARTNEGRDPGRLDDVNVVVVLSESFGDPVRLRGVDEAQDPIPFTRRLMRQTESGQLLAHQVGGGTANVEFETLTGMSLGQFAPQLTTPYQMLVPDYAQFPSAARYFAAHGHRAVALHPFLPQLYRRQEVYPVLGFERFIDRSAMRHTARIEHGVHVSDAAAFREAQDLIAAHRSPLLLNLVTMQNHGPYHDQYTDPIPVRNLHGDAAREGGDYLRGLQHSDDAMRDFIRELSRSKEKTLVIFYGDHAPGFWPPAVRIANGDRRMKETPYFIWSNFTRNEPLARPTTSPVYLLPRALDAVDAPVPAYYALLLELADEVPAMGLGSYIDTSDKPSNEADLSARGRALLRDYRLVQYDLSIGERYAERALYAMPPSSSEQASASAE